ncbi:MAG TPA: hypothetical protein DCX77_09270 [Acidimicrobiaceae bacterium]|nr:hypothetical protein [Acidimicrobiaceae bacterium]|tara:strand:+ start:773 stop:979 length:207 start_codon:yes stop_codon:yes gene_type:complete
MLEVGAIIGVAAVGALWRMAFEQGRMQRGMDAILKEVQMLRTDLGREVGQLSERLNDHEIRLRNLENR